MSAQDAIIGANVTTKVRKTNPLVHFIRHLLEMVIVMAIGMAVLGAVYRGVMSALGYPDAVDRYPELYALVMAFNMTLPMVALMRFRGHGWRPCGEMIAAMFVPTVLLVLLATTGTIAIDSLLPLEDLATLGCMLLIMIVRRAEYSCPAGRHPKAEGHETATRNPLSRSERKATFKQAKHPSTTAHRRAFRIHHGLYVAGNVILWVTWAISALTSGSLPSLWPLWLTVGCGICLALHAHILYRVREADAQLTHPELAPRPPVAP